MASAANAYWAGKPITEEARLSLLRLQAWHEDLFASSYEDAMKAFGFEVSE